MIPFAPSDDPVTVGPYTVALGIEPRSDGFAVALDVEYPNPGDSSGSEAFTATRSEDSTFGMLADAPEVVAYVDEQLRQAGWPGFDDGFPETCFPYP